MFKLFAALPVFNIVMSLDAQGWAQSASGMSNFSFKLQKCPVFKVLNLKRENLNGLALHNFSWSTPGTKFEEKNEKNLPGSLLVK